MKEENIINEQDNINTINLAEEKEKINLKKDKSENLVESIVSQKQTKDPETYKLHIITKQANDVSISIEYEKSELVFKCSYYKDYFKIIFKNSFSLDKLKEKSNYFNQFSEIKEVLYEIYFNPKKGQEYLDGNENLEDKIKLIIPLTSKKYPFIEFELDKEKQEQEEILEEYKKALDLYKNQIKIKNFNSKILELREKDKEIIKAWISPIESLKAKLLYSFYVSYKKDLEYFQYKINDKDINKVGTVQLFHEKCDNKKHILIICKSKEQIFGGYTPLRFKSDNTYGKDNLSFLFSVNRRRKYPKNNFDNNESIWRYREYGPSFHWDLYFRKNKMNTVKFEKKNYLTPSNWVDESKCYYDDSGILLDSLEIFELSKFDKFNDLEEDEKENIDDININNSTNQE